MKIHKGTAIAISLIMSLSLTPAKAAAVKNGSKCVKEGHIVKVGSKSFTCTNFRGDLLWADKTWAPVGSNLNAYYNAFDLLTSYSDNRLRNLSYEEVFNGSYAYRPWAISWCDDYFVTPSVFGKYYTYTSKDLKQAILGCTDAVMRRDG